MCCARALSFEVTENRAIINDLSAFYDQLCACWPVVEEVVETVCMH